MLKYTKKKGILLKMSMFAIISTYKKNLDEVDKKRGNTWHMLKILFFLENF